LRLLSPEWHYAKSFAVSSTPLIYEPFPTLHLLHVAHELDYSKSQKIFLLCFDRLEIILAKKIDISTRCMAKSCCMDARNVLQDVRVLTLMPRGGPNKCQGHGNPHQGKGSRVVHGILKSSFGLSVTAMSLKKYIDVDGFDK
jgi:hypothetical protein